MPAGTASGHAEQWPRPSRRLLPMPPRRDLTRSWFHGIVLSGSDRKARHGCLCPGVRPYGFLIPSVDSVGHSPLPSRDAVRGTRCRRYSRFAIVRRGEHGALRSTAVAGTMILVQMTISGPGLRTLPAVARPRKHSISSPLPRLLSQAPAADRLRVPLRSLERNTASRRRDAGPRVAPNLRRRADSPCSCRPL
jgi:hypothetical protein